MWRPDAMWRLRFAIRVPSMIPIACTDSGRKSKLLLRYVILTLLPFTSSGNTTGLALLSPNYRKEKAYANGFAREFCR